jgi:hypothetical protein
MLSLCVFDIDVNLWSQKKEWGQLYSIICTLELQYTNLEHHVMAFCGLTWEFMQTTVHYCELSYPLRFTQLYP